MTRHAAVDFDARVIDPYLRQRLIESCTRLGLPVWETVLRPRLHARIAAQNALMAQVRADAMRAQGKRPRGRDGRFVSPTFDALATERHLAEVRRLPTRGDAG